MAGLFWTTWLVALLSTGLVAGFMLSHAVLLGRFLDWLLAEGGAGLFASTYPAFALAAGRPGLRLYYAVCGLQVVAAIAFLGGTLVTRRQRRLGMVAGAAGLLWPAVHYASGFAAVEAAVLRSTREVSPEIALRFLAWNGPVHLAHVAVLGIGLVALLAVPITTQTTRD